MLIEFKKVQNGNIIIVEKEIDIVLTLDQLRNKLKDAEKRNKKLQESEQRYHRMIEEVENYAILLLDINGIVQNWNKGAEKIKGYKDAEIIGKSFKIFYLPKDQAKGLPEQLIVEATQQGTAVHEGWRVRKNGSTFWGSIVITALHDNVGNVVGFTKVTRDLTEKKLTEDRLKQYADELELKNKELEQFVYIASHDIKEPMRKVIMYTSLLKDNLLGKLPAKETAYLDKAINAAIRMQTLIDDLLDYSITSMQEKPFEIVDLNITLANTIVLYHEQILESGAVILIGKMPTIHAIPFQMVQLFDNLIGNAIKYRQANHQLTVSVSCETVMKPPAELNLLNDNGFYSILVKDNGIGFEEQYSHKIFDIFQRLVSKDEFPGTGIGLAICQRVVQNHKGDIIAHGKLKEGAIFNIYLPIN